MASRSQASPRRTPPHTDRPKADLSELTLVDEHRLSRRRVRSDADAQRFDRDLDRARSRIAARRANVPVISFPDDLPVSAARDEIAAAFAEHQVIVVAGETGSGKTTQLPKICLQAGRGVRGMIGHTQPRRIAARSVAERIADETGTEVGDAVGFSVRFTDRVGENTLVKVMTDGILLRELGRDSMLRAYDTLIIDEAHERSLNIDYIVGYLKRLLPRRPDLKVIITSATIDPQRFAEHFSTDDDTVPVLTVSGRTYPVEVRYRPLSADDMDDGRAADGTDSDIDDTGSDDHADLDQIAGIDAAIDELWSHARGDILVFLPTERDIRETADALRHRVTKGAQVVPLFARLSAAEQHKIFTPSDGRRIVLSTNLAETSLTVPGIRYVIDTGTARISRYSTRTKVQRLPIEPISQASARQRAGRCGRVAEGICIRLYSERDFEARPAFTDPEILRTNLAAVILSMTALHLGDIEEFPFLQPPEHRSVRDGVALLTELGAWEDPNADTRTLSAVGRELAQIPVDPRLGRMLIESRANGCLDEMLVIAAAMSLPDVRERPADHREAADTAHRRFVAPGSEFLTYLVLWDYLERMRTGLSGSAFRRRCEREFLHWLRIREWRDLHRQLTEIVVELGWSPTAVPSRRDQRSRRSQTHPGQPRGGAGSSPEPSAQEPIEPRPVYEKLDAAGIHRAILSGLLSQIGVREGDTREFLGARGTHFAIFPGSSLAKKPPRFVMAGEVVETSRLWARTAAAIEPEWAEQLAPNLVKRTYSEPHWSAKRGSAVAYERVTLFGVPLVTRRPVNFGRIDPEQSRELFIRHALVDGEWRTHHAFFEHNRALLDDAGEMEDRARRRDIVIDADALYDFYDRRIPADVVSTRHFDNWWKKARSSDPTLLDLSPAAVAGSGLSPNDFPTAWQQGDLRFDLHYRFEPGTVDDGVTVRIPAPLAPRVRNSGFDWLVPGFRHELVVALIRTLPKQLRRHVVPAPDIADTVLARLTPRREPLLAGLAREITALVGTAIRPEDFDPTRLPTHLQMHFALVDKTGAVIASADSLADLISTPDATTPAISRTVGGRAYTTWTTDGLGTLADSTTETVAGQQVTSYPGLARTGDAVARHNYPDRRRRDEGTREAIIALVCAAVPPPGRAAISALPTTARLALSMSPYTSTDALLRDCTRCAVAATVPADVTGVRTAAAFARLVESVRPHASSLAITVLDTVTEALARVGPVRERLRVTPAPIRDDVAEQLDNLVFDGFVSSTPYAHMRALPRYLDGIIERLDQLPGSATRDASSMAVIDRVTARWNDHVNALPADRRDHANDEIGWMVEELRVGLFAQRLGTAYPVSEKRVLRAISAVR